MPELPRQSSGERLYEVEISIRETGTRYVFASSPREAAERVRLGESIAGFSSENAEISGVRSVRRADPADLNFEVT